jgi:alkylated DNA nucleotide flippase Atl1
VIRSDGGFGGEKKGDQSRRNLLEKEGIPIENGRARISEEILI